MKCEWICYRIFVLTILHEIQTDYLLYQKKITCTYCNIFGRHKICQNFGIILCSHGRNGNWGSVLGLKNEDANAEMKLFISGPTKSCNFVLCSNWISNQFGHGISKMVGPKKQAFWPRIHMPPRKNL